MQHLSTATIPLECQVNNLQFRTPKVSGFSLRPQMKKGEVSADSFARVILDLALGLARRKLDELMKEFPTMYTVHVRDAVPDTSGEYHNVISRKCF